MRPADPSEPDRPSNPSDPAHPSEPWKPILLVCAVCTIFTLGRSVLSEPNFASESAERPSVVRADIGRFERLTNV